MINKIVGVSLIKNEEDIIASNIIHNTRVVDELIILDNQSTDQTPQICTELAKKYPITYIYDKTSDYQLIEKYDSLIKGAVQEHGADIVLPIDADEFLTPIKLARKTLQELPLSHAYHIYWINYTPTVDDNHNEPHIPRRITHHLDIPYNINYHKIILPYPIALESTVTMGCHSIQGGHHIKEFNNIFLAHYPIRTPQQLHDKVVKNVKATSYDKTPGNHQHVKDMNSKMLRDGLPSWEELPSMIYHYIYRAQQDTPLIDDPIQ